MTDPHAAFIAHLRFYKDLGIEEILMPAGRPLRVAAAPKTEPSPSAAPGVRATAPAAPAQADPAPKHAEPAPEWNYRPPADLFVSSDPPPADSERDPLTILNSIQADIGDCTRCGLHKGRSNIVFGVGLPSAKLVFVGEGPGADEDAQGIPFVGRAGKLLTQMINNTATKEGIAIQRDDVYICNVVKCRPPGNRAPEPDEMKTCGQFLDRQLNAIRPRAICVLGGTAAKYLLETRQGITKMRGRWHDWHGIPVMPTFHPSFLLRAYNKEGKVQAWQDLKKVLHYVYD